MKQEVKNYLKEIIPEHSIILEIGAHYGEDSTGFLQELKPNVIVCFEPDPRNIEVFKKHVKNCQNIDLIPCAVSNRDEKNVDFHLSYKDSFDSKMFDKYGFIDRKEYVNKKLNASGSSSLKTGGPFPILNTVKVDAIRLDTWAAKTNINYVDFAWIDVQGGEKEVIEGVGNLKIDLIWTEYGEKVYEGYMTREETIHLLAKKGFKVIEKYSDKGRRGDLLFRKM